MLPSIFSGINDASQLDKVLIDTRSGMSGDFANVTIGGFSGTVDYLTMSVRKSADGLQYLASYGSELDGWQLPRPWYLHAGQCQR